LENQRALLDKIGLDLGASLEDPSPWYRASFDDLVERGCGSILQYYKGSISKMLKSVYLERAWQPWRFAKLPKGLADDPQVLADLRREIEIKLNLSNDKDWHSISSEALYAIGVDKLVRKVGGLERLLSKTRPKSL